MKGKLHSVSALAYRLITPIIDPLRFLYSPIRYISYFVDLAKFQIIGRTQIPFIDLHPIIDQKTSVTTVDFHYFYQLLWINQQLQRSKPHTHVDIGSQTDIIPSVSCITKLKFVDIRPLTLNIENYECIKGDITKLPFKSNTIKSLSTLHVVEHVGLGRYGDRIDPEGSNIALKELSRVLSRGGHLYLSVPIGKPRTCFNAHRVFDPEYVINKLNDLSLVSFGCVDSKGNYIPETNPINYASDVYSLGLYHFKK